MIPRTLAPLALLTLALPTYAADPISYTLHADQPIQQIDPRIYGQFLEHIFNSVHGGLWADQLLNGSHELDPPNKKEKQNPSSNPAPRYWQFTDDIKTIHADNQNPLNADNSIHLESPPDNFTPPALSQSHIALKAAERYTLTLYARGTTALSITFTNNNQPLLTKQTPTLTPDWQKYTLDFTAPQDTDNATLSISLSTAGQANIDQLSLFSASALANHNLRPDLYKAIADLKPATIRWPGGSFANNYLWENGIGPPEKRLPHPVVQWNDRDPNQFGTDEFLQMCERLHADPVLVLNTSRGVDSALHWLHYCTDNPSTDLGQQRAKNGHPQPYTLHTIEIDNEAWLLMKYTQYLAIVKTFAPALRKDFPTLQLSVCGSYAYDTGPGEGDPGNANWDARILHDAGSLFDILSPHYYNGLLKDNPPDYAEDPRHYEAFLRSRADLIKNSPNPHIKLYISEWNLTHGPWGNDWRTGLYAGGILNAFERQSDIVQLSCPALFLRKIGVTKSWNNALINFNESTYFPAANDVVMKFWRDNFAPTLLPLDGPDHPLNTVATESEDQQTLYIKIINPEKSATDATFTLQNFPAQSATMQQIAPGSETAQNTIENPNLIHPEPAQVTLTANTLHATFSPLSAAIIKITR